MKRAQPNPKRRPSLQTLDDHEALEREFEGLQQKVAGKRAAYTESRAALDTLERETQLRRDRLEAIAQEQQRWSNRNASAGQQIEALKDRIGETDEELAGFADLPEQISARRSKLLTAISDAEAARTRRPPTIWPRPTPLGGNATKRYAKPRERWPKHGRRVPASRPSLKPRALGAVNRPGRFPTSSTVPRKTVLRWRNMKRESPFPRLASWNPEWRN